MEVANDTAIAAALLAVDPGLGGLILAGARSETSEACLAAIRGLLPFQPFRRLPVHASEERLSGGLDLAATLAADRLVHQKGLLAEVAGGVLVVGMAERIAPAHAALVAGALDAAEGTMVVLLDERREDGASGADEAVPSVLAERCAFRLAPDAPGPIDPVAVAIARSAVGSVESGDEVIEALCGAALALGIDSLRAPLLALLAARALAALEGHERIEAGDVATAARLVLGWRATRLPVAEADQAPEGEAAPEDDAREPAEADGEESVPALDDMTVEAAEAGIPPGLLAALASGEPGRAKAGGRAGGQTRAGSRRGRPIGVRKGLPREGARLALLATLRAAAPWQRLRQTTRQSGLADRFIVRRDDLHVHRTKPRAASTTIFAVDASGSAAAARLAEAKGAVERLLAECYIRRDEVAVIGFRGDRAELLLPPTRSLTRARRALSQLPGGGGTPLSAGLFAATALAEQVRRGGRLPAIVVLTDGRANIARDGTPGRARADAEAREAGRRLAATRVPSLLIDTAIRPQPEARAIAAAMAARYVPLPQAGARDIVRAVRQGG